MWIAGCSHPLWPVHPRILEDELLSSWIMRLAHANGYKIHTFLSLYFGRDKQVWNRDIDKLAPDWIIDGLSDWTGISRGKIKLSALSSYEGFLYERHNPYGNTKWLLPLGVYHRTRRRNGIQYCSRCLQEDAEPYYRKFWRLALYTYCPSHSILMRDRCYSCGAPVVFHRTELGKKVFAERSPIHTCFNCGVDLRAAPIQQYFWPTEKIHKAYTRWSKGFTLGFLHLSNIELNYSHLGYEILRQMCKLLISQSGVHTLSPKEVSKISGIDYCSTDSSIFEWMPLMQRHTYLLLAMWLLENWPFRFIRVINKMGLQSSTLLKDMESTPFWYEQIINENFYRPNPAFDFYSIARKLRLAKGQSPP